MNAITGLLVRYGLVATVAGVVAPSAGEFFWATQAGGQLSNEGRAIVSDQAGGCYVAGAFNGDAVFGDFRLTGYINSQGGAMDGIFLTRHDGTGRPNWVRQFGPGVCMAAAGDGTNAIYIAGGLGDPARFGSTNLSVSSWEIFVAKCAGNGDVAWARTAGGLGWDSAYGIAIDSHGDFYVTGIYQGSAGPLHFGSVEVQPRGADSGLFVAKYDSNGNALWVRIAEGVAGSNAQGRAVAVDSTGNVFVTGLIIGNVSFGGSSLTSSPGGYDMVLAKYDSTGNLAWVRQAGGDGGQDGGYSVGTDRAGSVYVAGNIFGRASFDGLAIESTDKDWNAAFVAKYASDGKIQWVKCASGGVSTVTGLAVDDDGNAHVGGFFQFQVGFGTNQISTAGFSDVFVAKYSSTGVPLWATQAGGGQSHHQGRGIAVDGAKRCYITGTFNTGTARFGSSVLTNAAPPGTWNVFVAQLGPALRLGNPSFATVRGFEAVLRGDPGDNYRVEVSTNLETWASMQLGTLANQSAHIADPGAEASSHPRFYRAVPP